MAWALVTSSRKTCTKINHVKFNMYVLYQTTPKIQQSFNLINTLMYPKCEQVDIGQPTKADVTGR